MTWTKKTAIVTGGGTGYGYGIAQALKERGAQVYITGRRREILEQAAKTLDVPYIQADVANAGDWDKVFEATGNKVDILINNAGGGIKIAPLVDQQQEDIHASLNNNLIGAILGCKRAAPIMIAQKSGIIINVSSICAHYGWPGFSIYSAAKAGLDQFSKTLYTELRPHHIRVTVLTPSWGNTQFSQAANLPEAEDETKRKMMSGNDMGKLVAQICEFPDHLEFPEIMVQPLIQEVIPF